jgi:hypothetical protein
MKLERVAIWRIFAQKMSNKSRRIIRLQPPHKPTPTLC